MGESLRASGAPSSCADTSSGGEVAKVDVGLFGGASADGRVQGLVTFNVDLFSGKEMARFARSLEIVADTLLSRAAVVQADRIEAKANVWTLPLVPANNGQRILWRFNDAGPYPNNLCVHDLVAAQAACTPDAIALEFRGDTMVYSEQLACAGRLSLRLRYST